MVEFNVGCVVIVKTSKEYPNALFPVGFVSKTDLVRHVIVEKMDTKEAVTALSKGRPVICVDKSASTDEAADVFMKEKVHHLVVVGE